MTRRERGSFISYFVDNNVIHVFENFKTFFVWFSSLSGFQICTSPAFQYLINDHQCMYIYTYKYIYIHTHVCFHRTPCYCSYLFPLFSSSIVIFYHCHNYYFRLQRPCIQLCTSAQSCYPICTLTTRQSLAICINCKYTNINIFCVCETSNCI